MPVHHRRIVENEKLLAARRSVALHQLEGLAGERLRQLARIGDGGRAADELRMGIVELADALQAAQQVRQVAAVDAAIVVQLVDHDVAQVLEVARPFGVVRQDAGVQHVGIGEHHVGALADGAARVLGGVAIVGEGADLAAHFLHSQLKLVELILGQRLGGEQVHGARALVAHQQIEHRQVVAERLAAGGRGDDDHVLAVLNLVEGVGLVGI